MSSDQVIFSAVLPTFNRFESLKLSIPNFLQLKGLGELVIIDDGSTDSSYDFLVSISDPRLIILRNKRNLGSPQSRMRGISASSSEWVLMLEDDCTVPNDFAQILIAAASEHNASISGAPWVNASGGDIDGIVYSKRLIATDVFNLQTHPSTFPKSVIQTPFLPALAIFHRRVFEDIAYQKMYRGNAWREETDLFFRALENGYKCIITPQTYSYQTKQWTGGQRSNVLVYEFWVFVNNWIFLRRHSSVLMEKGWIESVHKEQFKYTTNRIGAKIKRKLKRKGNNHNLQT